MSKARQLIAELLAASAPGEDEIGAAAPGGGGGRRVGGGGDDGDDGGGGDSGDGWKSGGGEPEDHGFVNLTYDLVDQAGVVSSSADNYSMTTNRAGWQKFVQLISQYLNKPCTLKDAVNWILKSGPMPGIETLWVMTQDTRLRPLTDFDEASVSSGADNLCVSYFYGGHERRAAFVKYGSHEPKTMAESIYNCLVNLHNGVEWDGDTTVTLPVFNESDGEWGPTEIVRGLREGGWKVDFDNSGGTFVITVRGFGAQI